MEYGQIFQVTRIGKYYSKNMKYRISNSASEAKLTNKRGKLKKI